MITMEEFDELEVGDKIETVNPFPALGDGTINLHLTEKAERATFVATYEGITLGTWFCTPKLGGLSWQQG